MEGVECTATIILRRTTDYRRPAFCLQCSWLWLTLSSGCTLISWRASRLLWGLPVISREISDVGVRRYETDMSLSCDAGLWDCPECRYVKSHLELMKRLTLDDIGPLDPDWCHHMSPCLLQTFTLRSVVLCTDISTINWSCLTDCIIRRSLTTVGAIQTTVMSNDDLALSVIWLLDEFKR